jgi:hypothetical protein
VTPSLRALQPFGNGDDLDGTILRAAITRAGTMLSLRWVLRAPADHWRLPGPRPGATRADRLWEHTCFEAFVAPAGGATYWELNVSPRGDWNAYRFEGYREGMQPEGRARPPVVRLERASCGTLTLHADFDVDLVGELRSGPLEAGIAAVLERPHGALTYWALAHTAATPDFHRRESFAVRLDAEDPA